MSDQTHSLPSKPPRAAFGKVVLCEARLAWRQPSGIFAGLVLPVVLLVIFGSIPTFRDRQASLGGLSVIAIYVPIVVALVIGTVALLVLPGPLVSYRELGVLRRLSTTPLPPSWVLAAQVVINAVLAVWALLILEVVGATVYGASLPKRPFAFALAFVLSVAALLAMGIFIAAIARTSAAARNLGAAFLVPLMFFAGLWLPQQLMPPVLRNIGSITPLGAAVQALQSSTQGSFPSAESLLVLLAYAVGFALLAVKFFRWE